MRVQAISNSGEFLPASMIDSRWGLSKESSFPLSIGKEYVVYAITAVKDAFWYYLLDDHDLPYPVWYPSPLFQVADGSLPAHWTANYVTHPYSPERIGTSLITFKEWASDPAYYENLVEGEAGARAAFEKERSIRA